MSVEVLIKPFRLSKAEKYRASTSKSILNFNNQNIQYRIIYNGSPKIFLNDMVNRNFDLAMENNVWTVK